MSVRWTVSPSVRWYVSTSRKVGKHAYPPLPTRPQLVLAVYPALFLYLTHFSRFHPTCVIPLLFRKILLDQRTVFPRRCLLSIVFIFAGLSCREIEENILDMCWMAWHRFSMLDMKLKYGMNQPNFFRNMILVTVRWEQRRPRLEDRF